MLSCERLAMCPVPLLGCLWDSEAPARRNLLVSASATHMYIACHMDMVREEGDFLARQLYATFTVLHLQLHFYRFTPKLAHFYQTLTL